MAIEAYSAKEHEADRLKASISWHLCFHMPKKHGAVNLYAEIPWQSQSRMQEIMELSI